MILFDLAIKILLILSNLVLVGKLRRKQDKIFEIKSFLVNY